MAITKRARVSFDFKLVVDSETEQYLIRKYIDTSKRIMLGDKTVSAFDRKLAEVAVEHGLEAAFELDLKAGIVSKLKDEGGDGAFLSQFSVRFKQ